MKKATLALIFLSGCSQISLEATDNALCAELKAPVDNFAQTLLRHKENTPDEVIIGGVAVIKGFDAGCN